MKILRKEDMLEKEQVNYKVKPNLIIFNVLKKLSSIYNPTVFLFCFLFRYCQKSSGKSVT